MKSNKKLLGNLFSCINRKNPKNTTNVATCGLNSNHIITNGNKRKWKVNPKYGLVSPSSKINLTKTYFPFPIPRGFRKLYYYSDELLTLYTFYNIEHIGNRKRIVMLWFFALVKSHYYLSNHLCNCDCNSHHQHTKNASLIYICLCFNLINSPQFVNPFYPFRHRQHDPYFERNSS